MIRDFLTPSDYRTFVSDHIINMFADKINSAEDMAHSFITSSLGARFDLDAELSKRDINRNLTLVRWAVSMSIYFLHNSIADSDIPERVEKNYNDARSEILKVSGGRLATDLTPLKGGNGTAKTRFRWGSSKKRSQKIY